MLPRQQDALFPHIWWQRWDWSPEAKEDPRLQTLNCFSVSSVFYLFSVSLFVVCLCFSFVWSPVHLRFSRSHWESMAGKGRKLHHTSEEDTEGKSELSGNVQSILEMFLESRAKHEAERRAADREEARRQADKIAEEERAEARAEAKARRRREEVIRAEEVERAREEAAKLASERIREQQEAAGIRAYEQQVALIKMQAEIGERTADAQRREAMITRKRDRAVSGIPNYRDSEDVEDFLLTSERKLRAGEVPEGEWLAIIAAKMSGKVSSTWQDLCMAGVTIKM